MKLSAIQIFQAIQEKRQLLDRAKLDFPRSKNSLGAMDDIMRIMAEIDELSSAIIRWSISATVNLVETYTVEEAARWDKRIDEMIDVWYSAVDKPERYEEMSRLISLKSAFSKAVGGAERLVNEFDLEPVLFKGTSIQVAVDAQVL